MVFDGRSKTISDCRQNVTDGKQLPGNVKMEAIFKDL